MAKDKAEKCAVVMEKLDLERRRHMSELVASLDHICYESRRAFENKAEVFSRLDELDGSALQQLIADFELVGRLNLPIEYDDEVLIPSFDARHVAKTLHTYTILRLVREIDSLGEEHPEEFFRMEYAEEIREKRDDLRWNPYPREYDPDEGGFSADLPLGDLAEDGALEFLASNYHLCCSWTNRDKSKALLVVSSDDMWKDDQYVFGFGEFLGLEQLIQLFSFARHGGRDLVDGREFPELHIINRHRAYEQVLKPFEELPSYEKVLELAKIKFDTQVK